jgi:hypothetical protein
VLVDLATRLAPEIDRLALCVHPPSGRHPRFRAAAAELPLPPGSILVVAARFLAAGGVTLDDLQLLSRYDSRALVAANVRRHVELGFLAEGSDGALVPTEAFRAAAALVLQVQAEAAAELWAAAGPRLEELLGLADRLVDGATERAGEETPAFAGQRRTHHVVPTSAAGRFLARCTELRYLRADLHAAALGRRGLAGPSARTADRLWRGHAITDEEGEALAGKGLAQRGASGWALCDGVGAARTAAEVETDAAMARDLDGLGAPDAERFVAGLVGLAGEDPRPADAR